MLSEKRMKMRGRKAIVGVFAVVSLAIVILSIQVSFSVSASKSPQSVNGVKTQLCMVVDGSSSISATAWDIIKYGIAKAINDTLPRDGSVELTIVQFGYSESYDHAKTEIPPTVIDTTNYGNITNKVTKMLQGSWDTPMAHGLYLGWKEIHSSPNFAIATKQVINLATDGEPNVRNNNATSDLDGSGYINEWDDVIAVVNNAVSQGLDELDVEGIGIAELYPDWFKNWVVRPQPGIVAPPFSKPGWIRVVADATEFANTISEKLQLVITTGVQEESTWAPSAEGALVAGALTVGITSGVSAVASAASNPENFPSNSLAQKISDVLPDSVKKWLDSFISSKTGGSIEHHVGATFMLTKQEMFSVIVSLVVITFAFSYAKAETLDRILPLIPIVLVTAIIVDLVKDLVRDVVARSQGVWSEYRLWYFGLAMFLISSIALKAPFSSPNRIKHHSPKFTKRSVGLVALTAVIIPLVFAVVFYMFFVSGVTVFMLIGNMGLIICFTAAFFDIIPIPPMNGKDIYDWNKFLWLVLFILCFALYALGLLLL
jgi:Zn-dependent protease